MQQHMQLSQSSFCGARLQQKQRISIRRAAPKTQALFGRKQAGAAVAEPPAKKTTKGAPVKKQGKTVDKATEYEKKRGFFNTVTGALDFSEARSKSDAELLYEAKYGKRDASGKMTREQYQALRRKVGGTAKDFWKTSIDVKGEYTDKGWVDKKNSGVSTSGVPGLPFLVATVLGLLACAAYVVQQTS